MADHLPIATSGPRSPQQRPRPIPTGIRRTIELMVRGRDDDEDCAPLDLVTAAREAGITPHLFRKYLDRPEVRSLLLRERKVFRDAICAGNEAALARVRDKSPNGMATVAAVRALENLTDEDASGRMSNQTTPGVTIRIIEQDRAAPIIDVSPSPSPLIPVPIDGRSSPTSVPPEPPAPEPDPDPIFQPPRRW